MINIVSQWQQQVIETPTRITNLICQINGKMILCGGDNGIMIFDPRNGRLKHRFGNQYIDLMDHCTQLIASSSHDQTVRIWNTKGKLIRKFNLIDQVSALSFSPNERVLAVGYETQGIQVINMKSEIRQLFLKDQAYISYICYSPDGLQLVVAFWDTRIYILDFSNGKIILELLGQVDPLPPIMYSPDGQSISACSQYGTIMRWNTQTGMVQGRILVGDGICVNSIAYSPDGKYLCSGQQDNTVNVWNIENGEIFFQFKNQKPIINVTFSPDSQFIVSVNEDDELSIQFINQKN